MTDTLVGMSPPSPAAAGDAEDRASGAGRAEDRDLSPAELAAVQTLYETDVETYVATWIAAATSRARDLGLSDDVPVLLSTDDTESSDDGDLEPLYDYAFLMTALPGCGYTPTTYPHRDTNGIPDVEAFVDAERTAHRSYRDRVAATRGGRRVPT